MAVERSCSNRSHGSRSSQSSSFPGQSSLPWHARDSSPLPGNLLPPANPSQTLSSGINTQEVQEVQEVFTALTNANARCQRQCGSRHQGEDPSSDAEPERPSKRRCVAAKDVHRDARLTLHDLVDSRTSPTQPGRGIRKIVDLYHDLTVLLSKARKQTATNALSGEALEEMDRTDFVGMTEEEIEEERKECAMMICVIV